MGALSDLKILDFTTLLPGPYATLMLADMGAEVLKISSASKPDIVTDYPPFIEGTNTSACQAWLGRNKKSMFLNLKTEAGKDVVRQLVKEYDIIIEQFRPGVMDKLGLGYDELKKVNPRLIYCSLTGYGQTGPLRNAAGHDINYMARSGMISHAGRKETGPSLMNFQVADIAAGSLNSVVGILAAVNYRKNTGKGQYIDISMMDGCVPFNSIDGASFLVSGEEPRVEAERLNGGCMYDFYQTKDKKYMSVGSLEPQFWQRFCMAIEREDLIEKTVWPEEIESIKGEIKGIFKTKTQEQWIKRFSEFDACVEPVLSLKEALLSDEHIKERQMVVDVKMPLSPEKSVKQLATAIKMSECPCQYEYAGYPAGYHTAEIVGKLGLSYEELEAKGVFK
ncbi:MAG: CoA transferase [Firmicutes bacterium]|nr:CoA transferase [Bacillota bacterium]